jgi:hypothetical protein
MALHLPDIATMAANIVALFATGTADEITKYRNWYPVFNKVISKLARQYKLPRRNVIGAFAWLSPQQSVSQNVQMTIALCAHMANGGIEDDIYSLGLSAYPDNLLKAWQCLYGDMSSLDFADANGRMRPSRKVRSFYRNLLGDDSVVTIDRHAVAIALSNNAIARNGRFATVGQPEGKNYLRVQNAYQLAAAMVNKQSDLQLSAPELQAIVWCLRRGTAE